jgi:hypothetical protein
MKGGLYVGVLFFYIGFAWYRSRDRKHKSQLLVKPATGCFSKITSSCNRQLERCQSAYKQLSQQKAAILGGNAYKLSLKSASIPCQGSIDKGRGVAARSC